jgi:hypothetical protein
VIKGAYDRLARKYHPDLNKDPKANQLMRDINEAYEILGNLEKRRLYHPVWLQKRGTQGSDTANDKRAQEAERQAREAQEREQEANRKAREAEEQAREAELRAMRAEYQAQQPKQAKNPNSDITKQPKKQQKARANKQNNNPSRWIYWTIGALVLVMIILIGRVIFPILFSESDIEKPITSFSPSTIYSPIPNVKINDVNLPSNAKVSADNSVFSTVITLENFESRDITVNWEGLSSTRGKFDYGVTVVPSNGIEEISKSYSYSQKGTETITYKIYYTDAYLKTYTLDEWVGTLNVLPSSTVKPAIVLSLTSGSRDTRVTIYGFNFTPFGTIKASNVTVNGAPQLSISQSSIDGTGSFTFNIYFLVNQPAGSVVIRVVDSSGLSASTNFTVVAPILTKTTPPPTLTISPNSGVSETPFTIYGYNFTPNGTVKSTDIYWNGWPLTFTQSYTIDTSGTVSISLQIKSGTNPGIYSIKITDSSGKNASGSFTVTAPQTTIPPTIKPPSITFSPSTATPLAQITISGFDFTPFATIGTSDILWDGISFIGSNIYTVDGLGRVTISFTLSSGTLPGSHTIKVTDSSGKNASAIFTVS